AALGHDINDFKFNSNVINVIPKKPFPLVGLMGNRNLVNGALSIYPDLLAVNQSKNQHVRELFKAGSSGIEFLNTLKGNQSSLDLIKKLLSKQIRVSTDNLCSLDLIIKVGENKNKFQITNLDECKW